MYQNQTSIRTKKQNQLKTKVQSFQATFRQSQSRMKSTSSLHNLAGKLYSNQYNRQFSKYGIDANGAPLRPSSARRRNNPQSLKHDALSGLQMRASHVVSYAEINTSLLKQKQQLQNLIKNLKERIVKEKKSLNEAEYNLKKHTNMKDNATDNYNDAHMRSTKLQQQINETNQDIKTIRDQKFNLKLQLDACKDNKQATQKRRNQLDESVKKLKHQLLNEEKIRTFVKGQLAKQLKVMTSCSIHTKQLQNQRAIVLLEINKFVQNSKI